MLMLMFILSHAVVASGVQQTPTHYASYLSKPLIPVLTHHS